MIAVKEAIADKGVPSSENKYERWLPKKSYLETEKEVPEDTSSLDTRKEKYHVNVNINLKKILRLPFKLSADLLRKIMDILFRDIRENINWNTRKSGKKINSISNDIKSLNKKLIELQYALNHHMFESRLQTLRNGEKLRIIFLFQVASFWPCWESFYQACVSDERFDVLFTWLDEDNKETTQMETAGEFLNLLKITFVQYQDSLLDEFNPHVLVMQTPYDRGHRQAHTWSDTFQQRGIRVVYIPYGIEIADTSHARDAHFMQNVILNSWRVYTFSTRMQKDYINYSLNGAAVRCVGIPKFDNFFHREDYPLNNEIERRSEGRKLFLWKVHFPKTVRQNGVKVTVTPSIDEYIKFTEFVRKTPEYFFIFMPHPKFCDENGDPETQKKAIMLVETLGQIENVFIDLADDYRPSLMHADYIMADRSAVIIEAGALCVPVMYLNNANFSEPMTEAVQPLIDSYYEGNSCEDMILFINMCSDGYDPRKEHREEVFRQCVPFFDGKSGWRIKEDIYNSVVKESERTVQTHFQLNTRRVL